MWMFDDMCHLKPHSEKSKNAELNDITKMFAALPKSVDKFHFPVHKKTDKYCQDQCNPSKELKKLGITKLNSPACEQAFKWINSFKNLKTMNESRFKLFLTYMTDLHNMHIDDSLDQLANPLNKKRSISLESKVTTVPQPKLEDDLDELVQAVCESLKIGSDTSHETFENYYSEDATGNFHCKLCPASYSREGNLRKHLESKHNKHLEMVCSKCSKIFSDSTRLTRHKRLCNK